MAAGHTGQHFRRRRRRPGADLRTNFHRPNELRAEAEAVGLPVVELLGVEGLASWLGHLAARWEDEVDRETILASARISRQNRSSSGLAPTC